MTGERLTLGSLGPRLVTGGLLTGVVLLGAATLLAGADDGWRPFLRGYLFAFIAVLSLSLGSLFFTILHHLTRAGWSVVVRRIAEAMAANLRWIWILFLPILWLVLSGRGGLLFEWADPVAVAGDPMLAHKTPYLNPVFWSIRAVVLFGTWAALTHFFLSRSRAQDDDGDLRHTHAMQRLAPVGMILYALTQSVAAIDWIESLEPRWFSTMFAVYFFAASACGFFSVLILFLAGLQRAGRLRTSVTHEHYHDVGKMLFAFGIVFWAYIAFSQYMLIWYADLPIETNWYMVRQLGMWLPVTLMLLFGHFVVPFTVLVSRWPKRWPPAMTAIAGWMTIMFLLDIYWLVMPVVPAEAIHASTAYHELVAAVDAGDAFIGYGLRLKQLLCVAGMGALFTAGTGWTLGRGSLIPTSDPRLGESLTFENF